MVSSFATQMAKFFRRLVKRPVAAPTGQPKHSGLGSEENEPPGLGLEENDPPGLGLEENDPPGLGLEDDEPSTEPKPKLTALYSYSVLDKGDLSFEKG